MTATDRPFVDRPAGPPAVTEPVALAAARHWGLARPVLVRTGMNAIYVADDVVIRVGATTAPPSSALALAGVLQERGLAVPAPRRDDAVEQDGLSATAWERVRTIDAPVDWRVVGAMIRDVHELTAADLPVDYPRPRAADLPWWDFDALLTEVGPDVDDRARAGLEAAVATHRWWTDAPEPSVICHGDVHPGNVLATAAGPMLLDWDLLSTAPRGWDHAMLVRADRWTYPAHWYDEFATGYGWDARTDPVTTAIAELRLVAATLMRVRAARGDQAGAPEVERRLRYWRGDPAAPPWHPA